MNKLKKWLFIFSDSFESIRGFVVIRRGLTASTPLIIIGALALMLTSLPIPAYQDFINSLADGQLVSIISLIYSACFNMLSLYMIIVICYNYSITHTDDHREAIIVSLIAVTGYCILNGDVLSGTISSSFDSTQLFSAIISALFTSWVYQKIKFKNPISEAYFTINSDSGFVTAVRSILPAFTIILLFAIINYLVTIVFKVGSIQGLFTLTAEKLFASVGGGYCSMLLYTFLVQLLWFFGIHGSNVLEPIIQSSYLDVGTNIFSKSFYDTFVNMGGSGVCLCVVISLLIFSKSKEVRYISKLGILPVLFNISEIISIGIPLLFNPIFLVPYLFIPVICGAIAYFATFIGLVPIVSNSVTWTTPFLFSGYYSTGSYAGVVLQLVLLIIGVLLYTPFVITYEERLKLEAVKKVGNLVEHMKECELNQSPPNLLKLSSSLGQTAKMLAIELKDAIENENIKFRYQPILDGQGSCVSCEALIRWNHPIVGPIYPPLIIQLAKEQGMATNIDRMVIQNACKLISDFKKDNGRDIKVAINLTVASLLEHDLMSTISEALSEYNIPASLLCIELTENEVFTTDNQAAEILDILSSNGHLLIIDDFGMGHTSLKYLQANQFKLVKLDRSLTNNIENNEVNQKIITSIYNLGNNLGFKIVAEGIENIIQYQKLYDLGCNYYQGYLYSTPLKADEIHEYYKQHLK